jgi:hypothetical protein
VGSAFQFLPCESHFTGSELPSLKFSNAPGETHPQIPESSPWCFSVLPTILTQQFLGVCVCVSDSAVFRGVCVCVLLTP